jgi:hypothetical protein
MNRNHLAVLGMLTGLLSAAAHAEPGEYWEVTNTMEMPGMPFAMPATTQKVCISKGSENNPEKTSGDKSCKMTDVKTVGNKTTWKARCDKDGEVMTGTGEQTTSAKGYQGKVKMSGKDMNMTMLYSGKRLGGNCDTGEAMKKIKEQACDTSRYSSTADWIRGADFVLTERSMCAEQRDQLCDLARRDTPKDVKAYSALIMHDQEMGSKYPVAKACKLDMKATTRSICKTFNADNHKELSPYCPAEAKKYREEERRKYCEGRSYTAETRAADLKKCLSGKRDASGDSSSDETPDETGKSSGSPADGALETAKKLRGKFGF